MAETTEHDAEHTTEKNAQERFARLGERVRAEMERLHVPGVAMGVLHEGREQMAAFGITSVENPLPVDCDTLFQIGSTTKTLTATAAMRLVERGALDLDAPIRRYLPELRLADPTATEQATLRHVFTHTGGWFGDYFDDFGPGDDALARMVARMADLEQLTPLGTVWSYNNAGYYLAGRVLEAVTGKTYEAVIKELVLEPLGMDRSFFAPEEVMTYRFAVGHQERDGKMRVARPWPLGRAANPAGGLASTVRDQLRYARFVLGDGAAADGTRLLAPATVTQMRTAQVPAGSMADEMGIGWMLQRVGPVQVVKHGGSTLGQLSAFQTVPERGFAITVLTNSTHGDELHAEVVKWALAEYLSAVAPEPTPLALTEEQLAAYAGRYIGQTADLDLSVRQGALWLQDIPTVGFPTPDSPLSPPDPPVRLAFVADDRVLALDPPIKDARGEFLRDAQGRLEWFRVGGRVHRHQG